MALLRKIWNGWKAIAHKIGNFQARIILFIFYFIVLAPFAMIMKRVDPMKMRRGSYHGWQNRPADSSPTQEKMIHQW
jgi:Saxitoxin biosynthesis operon protein SxtJ